MRIVPMTDEYVSQAADLEKENFSCPWSENAFREELGREDSYYVVALEDEKVIGVCGSMRYYDEADILNVSVSSEYRRQGIAEAMLTEVFRENEDRGVRAFILEVRRSNAPAIALYEKLGFEFLGYRQNFYEKPVEDAAIYRKEIVGQKKE